METTQLDSQYTAPDVPQEFAEAHPPEWSESVKTLQGQLKVFKVRAADGPIPKGPKDPIIRYSILG